MLALAEVSLRSHGDYVSTQEIANVAAIPYPHFAKTIALLKRAGLIATSRGKAGGILLVRPATEIGILNAARSSVSAPWHDGVSPPHGGCRGDPASRKRAARRYDPEMHPAGLHREGERERESRSDRVPRRPACADRRARG